MTEPDYLLQSYHEVLQGDFANISSVLGTYEKFYSYYRKHEIEFDKKAMQEKIDTLKRLKDLAYWFSQLESLLDRYEALGSQQVAEDASKVYDLITKAALDYKIKYKDDLFWVLSEAALDRFNELLYKSCRNLTRKK